MRIRMNTLSAGPRGILLAGQEYELPDAEARELVAGGYATAARPPAAAAVNGSAHKTAAKKPAESAGSKKAQDKPKPPPEAPSSDAPAKGG